MVDAASVSAGIAQLCGRLGGNERVCYRWLIERTAPDVEDAVALLSRCSPFLISSTGRTGTKWLANLLNEVEQAFVVHEPVPQETFYHAQALTDPKLALPYMRDFRLREMAVRILPERPMVYGEVNGALRRHIAALRQLVPEICVIHLVRDGRDVVASIMNRKSGTSQDKIYGSLKPPPEAIDRSEWSAMDRFARVCWMWATENAYIREHAHHRAKFEEITVRYDQFKKQILLPLALDLDKDVWASRAKNPVNQTLATHFPKYEHWSDEQKDTFWRLCGAEMAFYGYGR